MGGKCNRQTDNFFFFFFFLVSHLRRSQRIDDPVVGWLNLFIVITLYQQQHNSTKPVPKPVSHRSQPIRSVLNHHTQNNLYCCLFKVILVALLFWNIWNIFDPISTNRKYSFLYLLNDKNFGAAGWTDFWTFFAEYWGRNTSLKKCRNFQKTENLVRILD